jgi:hypothetical protein
MQVELVYFKCCDVVVKLVIFLNYFSCIADLGLHLCLTLIFITIVLYLITHCFVVFKNQETLFFFFGKK